MTGTDRRAVRMRSWRSAAGVALVAAAALAAPGCATAGGAGGVSEDGAMDVRSIAGMQKVRLGGAIERAMKARPGQALAAELEGEVVDGAERVFVEVAVLAADGALHEVKVDAVDGHVVSDEVESDADDLREAADVSRRVGARPALLLRLCHVAQSQPLGRLVAAWFRPHGEGAACVVRGIEAGEIREIVIDAATGTPTGPFRVIVPQRGGDEAEEGAGP